MSSEMVFPPPGWLKLTSTRSSCRGWPGPGRGPARPERRCPKRRRSRRSRCPAPAVDPVDGRGNRTILEPFDLRAKRKLPRRRAGRWRPSCRSRLCRCGKKRMAGAPPKMRLGAGTNLAGKRGVVAYLGEHGSCGRAGILLSTIEEETGVCLVRVCRTSGALATSEVLSRPGGLLTQEIRGGEVSSVRKKIPGPAGDAPVVDGGRGFLRWARPGLRGGSERSRTAAQKRMMTSPENRSMIRSSRNIIRPMTRQ